MLLRSLYLHNFRCYRESLFHFSPEVNLICGANARGKTSILEAIHFLSTGRSFRTSQTSDLIRLGASSFYLEAHFVKHGIEQTLKVGVNSKERKIIHNQTSYSSSSGLLGLLQGVVVTPDDVALMKGSPLGRRQFLDLHIAQSDPLYMHHLTRYYRAMRQRNSLLRAKIVSTIVGWEHEMANSAAYLTYQRYQAVEELQMRSQPLHHHLTNELEPFVVKYKTTAPAEQILAAHREFHLMQFQKYRARELAFGTTLTGPHKDDIVVAIGDKEVRFFASEGQQRSCASILRLAEWERLNRVAEETPLMLLDDFGVSLDADRRNRLFQHVESLGQVFLTSTQPIEGKQKGVCITRL